MKALTVLFAVLTVAMLIGALLGPRKDDYDRYEWMATLCLGVAMAAMTYLFAIAAGWA